MHVVAAYPVAGVEGAKGVVAGVADLEAEDWLLPSDCSVCNGERGREVGASLLLLAIAIVACGGCRS